MRFSKASSVRTVINEMRENDNTSHSANRAHILELFEGFPPFTESEAEQDHLNTNCNFLEPASIAHKALATWNNAFLKPGNRYKVTLDSGPIHKRSRWQASINTHWNRPLKTSLRYIEAIRGTGASVIMFGIGPKTWTRSARWCPHEIGVEDLLVPGRTRVNLENMQHFAIWRKYTPEELFRATTGKRVDPGWNMPVVGKELKRLARTMPGQEMATHELENFEKMVRYYKSNSGVLDTDVVATCNTWDFYHQDEGKWYRSMVLEDSPVQMDDDFLYRSPKPYASSLSQILHIQFGDGALSSPFLYHSVRSLGFLLYAICNIQNRLRCRFTDAIFEATNQYFRVRNAEDRARLGKVDLVNMGWVPEGLEFVKSEERWKIDGELVVAGLSQNRQLMSENAASYTQDMDNGTAKELTATEVMARLNSANALVSSLLSMAYTYDRFEGMEIGRRFCLKNTGDPDIEHFRQSCLKDGVPEEFLNSERWNIEPERVLGGGNKTLELSQAEALMSQIDRYDPEAQGDILREWTLAITDNPDQAQHWVPIQKQQISSGGHDAQLAFGSLMSHGKVTVQQGIDHIGYVNALIESMESLTEDLLVLAEHGHQPTQQDVRGLVNCYQHAIGHIKIVAQNKANASLVKKWGDRLKVIMNYVKSWGQQLDQAQEAAAQQNGDGGKTMATLIKAKTDAKVKEATAAQKLRHGEQKFAMDQRRRNVQTAAEIQRQKLMTAAQVEATDKQTAASIRSKRAAAFSNKRKSDD